MSGPDTKTVIHEDPSTLAEGHVFMVTVSIEMNAFDEEQAKDRVLARLKDLHVGYIDAEEL